ncbi:MAG TPA: SDR family NAD(P)-dependent oxidoreductase [Aeromicrobium sp.]|nr:SDR family NAD(P)-dependent oxidoreductase [Aeromicrobium sp.]
MYSDRGIDRLLDRTVALGYSQVGYAIRSRKWPAHDPGSNALAGQNALVTGAGGGLGEATSLALARLGARVHLLVRNPERAGGAVERISAELGRTGIVADLAVEQCDISSSESIERFATDFVAGKKGKGQLDILVHNAGVMPPERLESMDGHELSLATHVLGPALLTERLLPVLKHSECGARVILVSSGGMYTQPLETNDPEFNNGDYSGPVAYARTKRMQVALTPFFDARWKPADVSVYSMHPGWVDTPGIRESLPRFRTLTKPLLRSPDSGSDTTVWLAATTERPPSGTFWHDRKQRPTKFWTAKETPAEDTEKLNSWVWETIESRTRGKRKTT